MNQTASSTPPRFSLDNRMRNPERIDAYCDRLKELWHKVPDWRFGQLMCNLLGQYTSDTGNVPFFPEDEELFGFFDKYFI